jgi:hypothetical protein
MVSMSELIAVVSANTADLVCFIFLFFASADWVAAWEADIFPAVCHVRRGAATLDGALSPPLSRRRTRRREAPTSLAHLQHHGPCNILVVQWCWTPVDALAMLKTQDATISSDSRPKT